MLIPAKLDSLSRVTPLLKRNNIAFHELSQDHFSDKNLEQDLGKIYKFDKKQTKNVNVLRELS